MEDFLRKLFVCQGVKKIIPTPRMLLGVSLCSATGYILYLMLKNRRDTDDICVCDTYSDTYVMDEEYVKLVIQVPRKYVPYIIGRKGQTIRSVEEYTSTKITFDSEINNETYCECTIRGLAAQCEEAEIAIEEIMEQTPIIYTESFAISRSIAPNVAGKYLEKLITIQDVSGSKLWLSEDVGSELRIFIKGTTHQIKNAAIRVNELIAEEQRRHEMLEEKLSLRLPRFSPTSETVSIRHMQQYCEKLAPSVSNGLIEVYVSAVTSPSKFVVQIVGPKANELDLLVELMTEYYTLVQGPHVTVEVDDIIAAPYQHDDKWYRAKVLSLQTDHAEVYYVDYGDHGNVPYDKLHELTAEYMALPYQGIECFLAQVLPVDDEWTEQAIDAFAAFTHVAQWIKLIARVNRYREQDATLEDTGQRECSTMAGIELYDINKVRDINIGLALVRGGHAVFDEPTAGYPSKRVKSPSTDSQDTIPFNLDTETTPHSVVDIYVPELHRFS